MPEKKKFTGLSQYKIPYCYELAGKKFHIVMDGGAEYLMDFTDEETVTIFQEGKAVSFERYECLKGDDRTYLVHWTPKKHQGKINCALVIDLWQSLVTFVNFETGYDPEYPRLIRITPYFGAIKTAGEPLPAFRHHLSARMNGKHVQWRYMPGISLQHIYFSPNALRASGGPGAKKADQKGPEWYPFFEEPCFHIYISESLNLFCFFEENRMRRCPDHSEGGSGLLLLQDIDRVLDVGIGFNANRFYMVSAFGEENEIEDPLDKEPSPYDWNTLTSMPTIHWEVSEI